MAKFEFMPNPMTGGNFIADGEGFRVSYVGGGAALISMFAGDNGGDETALVHGGKYYILNGDWRSKYEPLIEKGFDACFDLFKANEAEHRSSWSEKSQAA